jgi:hypothetical protein
LWSFRQRCGTHCSSPLLPLLFTLLPTTSKPDASIFQLTSFLTIQKPSAALLSLLLLSTKVPAAATMLLWNLLASAPMLNPLSSLSTILLASVSGPTLLLWMGLQHGLSFPTHAPKEVKFVGQVTTIPQMDVAASDEKGLRRIASCFAALFKEKDMLSSTLLLQSIGMWQSTGFGHQSFGGTSMTNVLGAACGRRAGRA